MATETNTQIVKMKFDNKQFEKGVKQTLKSLDNLKEKLNFKGAHKSLKNLEKVANKNPLDGLSRGIESVSIKMKAMDILWNKTIGRMVDTAVNAGTRMAKALTIDPIRSGMSEYESKMGAITTIMTNTQWENDGAGQSLQSVTDALNELNIYADKTIYNFEQMTRNIGTFTAAGVKLEDAVPAIKGIANLAAKSGSTSQQASTAMYQLSQALASGTVKLMDWNSVVNAGMGGKLFQDALKKTAKDMHENVDESVSFRDSLQSGWLTSKVLLKTLKEFSTEANSTEATQVKTISQLVDTLKESAQSGWAETWEYIIGNKDQAVETLTRISDAVGGFIGRMAESRNLLAKWFNEEGYRQQLIDGMAKIFTNLGKIIGKVAEAFREVFPSKSQQIIEKIVKSIRNFGDHLEKLIGNGEQFKLVAKGIFSGLSVVFKLIKAVATGAIKATSKVIATFSGGAKSLFGIIGEYIVKISNFLIKLNEEFDPSNIIKVVGNGFQNVLLFVINVLKNIFVIGTTIVTKILSLFGIVKTAFAAETNNDEPVSAFAQFMQKFVDVLKNTLDSISSFASNIKSAVGTGIQWVIDLFGKLLGVSKQRYPETKEAVDDIKSPFEVLGNIMSNVINMFKTILDTVKQKVSTVFNFIKKPLLWLWDLFVNIGTTLSEMGINKLTAAGLFIYMGMAIKQFMKIAKTFVTGFLDIFGKNSGGFKIFMKSLSNLADKFGDTLDAVTGHIKTMTKEIKSKVLINIAKAMALLAGSMLVLALIPQDKLVGVGVAVSVMMAELTFAMNSINRSMSGTNEVTDWKSALAGGLGDKAGVALLISSLVGIASAVLIMSFAMKTLASTEPEKLIVGIIGVSAALFGLVEVIKHIGALNTVFVDNANLTTLSTSTTAMQMFATFMGIAVALLAMSKAIKTLANVVAELSAIDKDALIRGGIAVLGILGALTAFIMLINTDAEFDIPGKKGSKLGKIKPGGLNKMAGIKGVGIIFLAGAINILTSAVTKLGNMDVNTLKQGMIYLSILMGLTATLLLASGFSNSVFSAAIGITILSMTISLLAKNLEEIGANLNAGSFLVGLAAFSTILFSVALAVMAISECSDELERLPKVLATSALLITGIAFALKSLSKSDSLKTGVAAASIAGVILAIAMAFKLLMKGWDKKSGGQLFIISQSMINMAKSILILAPSLWILSKIPLLTLAGIMTIFVASLAGIALVSKLLAPASVALHGLGTALLMISGAMGIAAISFGVMAASLFVLGMVATTSGSALFMFLLSMIGLLPLFSIALAGSIVAFIVVLGLAAKPIGVAVEKLLNAILTAIINVTPKLLEALGILITGIIELVGEAIPVLLDTLSTLVPALVEFNKNAILYVAHALGDNAYLLANAAMELLITTLESLANSIYNNAERLGKLAWHIIEALIVATVKAVGSVGKAIISTFRKLFEDDGAFDAEFAGKSATESVTRGFSDSVNSSETKHSIKDSFNNLKDNFKSTLGEAFGGFDLGKTTGATIIDGINEATGGNINLDKFKNFGSDIKSKIGSTLSDKFKFDFDTNPTISPVVDMSNVDSAISSIKEKFSSLNTNIGITRGTESFKFPDMSSDNQNGIGGGITQIFNQYNNSPKALSTPEIYRDTKTAFATFKLESEGKI